MINYHLTFIGCHLDTTGFVSVVLQFRRLQLGTSYQRLATCAAPSSQFRRLKLNSTLMKWVVSEDAR